MELVAYEYGKGMGRSSRKRCKVMLVVWLSKAYLLPATVHIEAGKCFDPFAVSGHGIYSTRLRILSHAGPCSPSPSFLRSVA